jgi:hypothetical protein
MIITVGDSVCWGQGLKEEHKFDALFAAVKGMELTRLAHSGAVIGSSTDSSTEAEDGEIPVPYPSVWQQILSQKDWSQVETLLLNGGLTDVGLFRILSPWTSTMQLTQLVDQFCNKHMQRLLEASAGKLTAPDARVAVVGYYPILSPQSEATETQFQSLLELHGIATTLLIAGSEFSFSDFIPRIVENCLTFWNRSNDALQSAVHVVNATLGRDVCEFVKLPFTEENAMWAPHSLLWELTPLLLPEDEVSEQRAKACEMLYRYVVDIPQLIECVRASAGHPTVEGAARIAETLSGALWAPR